MRALLAGPRRHQTTPRPRQDRPLKKYRLFIKNVSFSLEKCRFGAHRGVLHYVLNREWALPRKNGNFELEICVKERGGRAARCMGSVVVAEIVASEARRSPASCRALCAYSDPSNSLFPGDRSRESCGTLQLPQTTTTTTKALQRSSFG